MIKTWRRIYGIEDDKRYVTEQRLRKMLQHEINLIEQRIKRENHPNKIFFSYANTVTIILLKNLRSRLVGLKYQLEPEGNYNEIILHVVKEMMLITTRNTWYIRYKSYLRCLL